MTVRTRLVLTFALVGGTLAGPALFAAVRLGDLRELAVRERGRQAEAVLAVGRMEASLVELEGTLQSYVATTDEAFRGWVERILRGLDAGVSRIDNAGFGEIHAPVTASLEALDREARLILWLVEEGRLDEATDRFTVFQETAAATDRRLRELAREIGSEAEEDFERARAISSGARRATVLAVAAAAGLTLLLAGWTTGALTVPLRDLRTAMVRVAEGDFHAPSDLPYDRRDEIGDVAVSFETMTRRLAELDRLKAEFIGVASHELKTPINVIRGYTELIEEELAGELTPHQREIMERIVEQTRVLTRQVSRLMDISRLESGSYAVEPEAVLLEDLVRGVQRAFEVLALKKGVELTAEVAPDAPERLVVDVDLIRDEVLGNLVSNAVKFTPEGGRVDVRAWGEADGVAIEVSDTGPGVPREDRDLVFQKYYQVERSRAVGSGLGLAIAREVVAIHGGTIVLVEDAAPGATFRVWLPVGNADRRARAAEVEATG